MSNSCVIAGTVRNCGKYLDKVFVNMEKLGDLFDEFVIMISYDKSSDNTLAKIKTYQLEHKNVYLFINGGPLSSHRTHNIAAARNKCIQKIREDYSHYKYFIMMDCDDVCSSEVKIPVLHKYLIEENDSKWDCLTFNKRPYYDTWALSIGPLAFSCHHVKDGANPLWGKYVNTQIRATPPGTLIPCYSAFNGFGIYKTEKFINCVYDGRIRLDLIPKRLLNANLRVTGPFVFHKMPYQDCEHRSFHFQAIHKTQARIRIAPEVLF